MPTAIIAEDEPTVARHLKDRLEAVWPELKIVAISRTVSAAIKALEEHRPEIAFLDIRMPGGLGIDIPLAARHRPLYVFVTAYDEFALRAFESAAVDYLLKPVADERLAGTVERLKDRLSQRAGHAGFDDMLQQLQAAFKPKRSLQWLKVGKADTVQMVAVEKVCYFRAQDGYTKAVTPQAEHWIRTSLKDLMEELDPDQFQSVHRDTIVRLSAIAKIRRDFSGRVWIQLKDRPEELSVSRRHADVFRQM